MRCFNPRARVGRDVELLDELEDEEIVSIHAPAWGATSCGLDDDSIKTEFQSTRPRGARHRIGGKTDEVLTSFNPRARVGRDHCMRRKVWA